MYIRIALGFVPTFLLLSIASQEVGRLRYAPHTTHNVDSIPKKVLHCEIIVIIIIIIIIIMIIIIIIIKLFRDKKKRKEFNCPVKNSFLKMCSTSR